MTPRTRIAPTTRTTRAALIGIPALLGTAALLAGCAAGPATSGVSSTGSTGTTSTASGSTAPGVAAGDLAAAGKAALKAAGSGTIISIEREDSGVWEVKLAAADGTETEVHVTADGTVTAGPETKADDADDKAENVRFLDAAKLSWSDAADKLTAAQAGTVVELNLDDHAGGIVWEGDVIDSSGAKHSVAVDAATGAAVQVGSGSGDDDSDD